MARILISAGEASGDIHAAAVTRELKNIAPDTEVFGMGGDCLREAGGEVLFDIKEHGVMGFAEIVCKLPALFKLKKAFAKKENRTVWWLLIIRGLICVWQNLQKQKVFL